MTQLIWPTAKDALAHCLGSAHAPLRFNPTEHVLNRLAFGPTPGHRAWIAKHGIDAWFVAQVSAGRSQPIYAGNAKVAAVGPLLKLNPADLRDWLTNNGDEYGWDAMDQLTRVTVGLQAWSSAQLYEVLVDFFSNHLNVANHRGDLWVTRHTHDRDVVRKYALGTYTDMLLASARNPAMLNYLTLADSTKSHVNENYGRELLELHTVGLHYTESDVVNAAKALTGRTLDEHQHYLFDDYIHPTGPLKVLAWTHPNADATQGEAVGDSLLRYLAAHPATAQRLATKLCQRLVSDTPSAALVNAVAQAYLEYGTAIVPMVRTIFHSTEFWQSRGMKVKRPFENVVSTIRALAITPSNYEKALETLHWVGRSVDHLPLEWPAPNGYPDVAAAWRSSGDLLRLWDYHLGFVGGWFDGLPKPSPAALWGTPATSGAALAALTKRLTGTYWSSTHLAVLQTFLGEPASTPMSRSKLQWMFEPVAGVILHGPHHALR
ncbi:MAG: DUF1800 domain-containing protein [Jatrophihabitans sp.]|uniref:DUF1800 domain-containing protein n=1 Tax=Jatrophihabitans sp. TaxID=1932789 RepID=UPI003F7DEA82